MKINIFIVNLQLAFKQTVCNAVVNFLLIFVMRKLVLEFIYIGKLITTSIITKYITCSRVMTFQIISTY